MGSISELAEVFIQGLATDATEDLAVAESTQPASASVTLRKDGGSAHGYRLTKSPSSDDIGLMAIYRRDPASGEFHYACERVIVGAMSHDRIARVLRLAYLRGAHDATAPAPDFEADVARVLSANARVRR